MHEELFYKIATELETKHKDVTIGKMMSAPGIRYKTKVFAFYWKKEMIFKLGKYFDPKTQKLKEWKFLQPFKNKGPMTAWFVVPNTKKWKTLAKLALEKML